jgi:2-dehydro-3-deoxyphosphogluconate aldolase/(4S)-4-hydroxy-2-oxoglutarate aldolase
MNVEQVMILAPVIPVLVIEDLDHAVPIAEALVAGGLRALEVTLRTPQALDVIRAMSTVDGAVVGAGTVLNPKQLDAAIGAGARFIVSPGLTEPLGKAAITCGVPFLPGIASASDIMRGLDLGLSHFKFFPAVANGGIPALKSLAAPFQSVRFCPTGGVTQETARDWLSIPEVLCVGGSWLVPGGCPDAEAITARARRACAIARVCD